MTLVLVVTLTASEGEEETISDGLVALAAASRTEAGCLMFNVHRDASDPRVFLIYEQWVDRAALDAHRETDHFRDIAQPQVLQRASAVDRRELALL